MKKIHDDQRRQKFKISNDINIFQSTCSKNSFDAFDAFDAFDLCDESQNIIMQLIIINTMFKLFIEKIATLTNVFIDTIILFYRKFLNENVIVNVLKKYSLMRMKNEIEQYHRIYNKFEMQFDVNI